MHSIFLTPWSKYNRKEQGLVGCISNHLEVNKKESHLLKRVGYIYENIYDIENIKLAIVRASEKKRNHHYVKEVLENINHYALAVQIMLQDKTFRPSKPTIKTIVDSSSGKIRTIYKPRFFPDQIVHWALMLQIEPVIMRGMYQYSCGSIPGRGGHYAQKAVRKWLDDDPKQTKYALTMDIRQFYPSIDNDILKQKFRRKIKDQDCLWLIDSIIDSNQGQPIGHYTSQWFANFFLEDLDHFIKEKLGVKYYVRYIDDLVMFGNNKRKLHKARQEITQYCNENKLSIKPNWQVFQINHRALDFLGVRSYRTHTTLRGRLALRIRRRMAKIKRKGYLNEDDARAVISYWGWIKRTNSYSFYHKYMQSVVTIQQARKAVSINAKIRQANQRGATYQRPYTLRLQAIRVRKVT